MSPLLITYAAYVAVAVPLTVWVGRSLSTHGGVFLVDVFDGDRDLAGAVNRLLEVGFYLANVGFVLLALRISSPVPDAGTAVEQLAVKLGLVSLVLGAVHLANLYVLNRMRRRANEGLPRAGAPNPFQAPPVAPDYALPVA